MKSLAMFGALAVLLALTTPGRAATALDGDCLQAGDYGAIADDGLDDRPALQAAIDAALAGPRCLALGPGTYHVTRKQFPGDNGIPSLQITGPFILQGAGQDETTLALLGPGTCTGCQSYPNPTDWRLLDVTGEHVTVRDLTLDGSERVQTTDQTHLLQVNGPAHATTLERLTTVLPIIGPSAGGDCIRLLGKATARVRRTTIRQVYAPECDRSFIGIQRGVEEATIEDSESVVVGDQAIDFEPTGGPAFHCTPIVRDVVMRRLILRRGANAQGPYTVGLNGAGCAMITAIRLEDSLIDDGGLFLSDVAHVTLQRLSLRNRASRGEPTVLAQKRIEGLHFLETTVERVPGSPVGSVLRVQEHAGIAPTSVLVLGGEIVQRGEGVPVSTLTLGALTLVGTRLVYEGTDASKFAIVAQGVSAPAGIPVLVDVTILGSLAGAVKMAGLFTGQPVLVRVTGP